MMPALLSKETAKQVNYDHPLKNKIIIPHYGDEKSLRFLFFPHTNH